MLIFSASSSYIINLCFKFSHVLYIIAINITCLLVSRSPGHCPISEMYQFLIATLIYALCSEGKANYCACQTTLCVVEGSWFELLLILCVIRPEPNMPASFLTKHNLIIIGNIQNIFGRSQPMNIGVAEMGIDA